MDALAAALVAPFALAVGSFLNVVIARVPEGRSINSPGSCCPECETPIRWYDNIPVLSWLLLRGQCRDCRARISLRYPAIELLTLIVLSAIALRFGFTWETALYCTFAAALIALSVIDFDHHILPNRIVLPLAVLVLSGQIALQPDRAMEWIAAALGASGFLLALALLYPAGMGMGDVKLALALGAALGLTVTVAMMFAFLTAGILGVALLVRHGSAARKMPVPLGPFLAAGALVALFAGQLIIDLYTGTWQ